MREEISAEQDVPAVLQAEDAFDERERSLHHRAVVAVVWGKQLPEGAFPVPREIVQRRVPDHALEHCIQLAAVVVQRERADDQEKRAHERQRPMGGVQPPERRRDAHADTFMAGRPRV